MTKKQIEEIFSKLKELDNRVKKLEKAEKERNPLPKFPKNKMETEGGSMFDVT